MCGLLLSACTSSSSNIEAEVLLSADDSVTGSPLETSEKVTDTVSVIDPTSIPIGDGRTVTEVPSEKGYLYVCRIVTGGGGGFAAPWINGDSWDLTKKVTVSGENFFSNASHSFNTNDGQRIIATNGLPSDTAVGNFPVSSTDEAYSYDRNPNSVLEQSVTVTVPGMPSLAGAPSCTGMGAIGYALNGVAIFNAVDAENRDAVAHEVQDVCDGHPEKSGTYHYHNGSTCLTSEVVAGGSKLIGYALDGFGIYVEKDAQGHLKTNADLDVCHGRTSKVLWNGVVQEIYHYSVTLEFPYTVGCFMGTPTKTVGQGPSIGEPHLDGSVNKRPRPNEGNMPLPGGRP